VPAVFKKQIVRYKDADGRQVPKGTPGATRHEEQSSKWYGRVPGEARPRPLCRNRKAAEVMLGDLIRKAENASVGIGPGPFEKHHAHPLAGHLADFEAGLLAKGGTRKHALQVVARVKSLLDACGFAFIADFSASRVAEHLARMREAGRPRRPLPPLDPAQESFTKEELARAVGRKPEAAAIVVRRRRLPVAGTRRNRLYPRATVLALREPGAGASVKTCNLYLDAVKSFCAWLVKDRRTADNPLAHLSGGNVKLDRRHDRRELEADELRRLLAATRASTRTFRGLTGEDRFHLYATACGTGFRAGGLASLTPESFDLDAGVPTVTLAARRNKSRVLKVQPLPPDVAGLLRGYLAGRPAGGPVWGGPWAREGRGAEMLRIDLEAAGIPYTVEGPDGPLFADFHALRHTYLTLGGRAGIDLRTLQELAGHSTPTLTARYSHRRLHDLAGAVERLPSFLPVGAPEAKAPALRATGTDGRPEGSSCSPVAQGADGGCGQLRVVDGGEAERPAEAGGTNPLVVGTLRVADGDCVPKMGVRPEGAESAAARYATSRARSPAALVRRCVAAMRPLAVLPAALLLSVALAWDASPGRGQDKKTYEPLGTIERLDPAFDELIPKDALLERLDTGFEWVEGPVWVPREGGFLLFSDIPRNSIFRWQEGKGTSLFMKPSGYTGSATNLREPGTNGLLLDREGRLVMMEHGDRRVSRLEGWGKDAKKVTLADRYEGKRLNSPNDGTFRSNGDLYFTDPPYGRMVKGAEGFPDRDLDFCGVYRLSADGKLTLLTKEMSFPNGITFSPDEKTLYVANSDPKKAVWMAFDVKEDGTLGKGRVFYDATEWAGKRKGLPDGMKADRKGNLFATGPGGLLVFTPEAKLLGVLATGVPTANCNWGDDGSVLYVAADKSITRIRTHTRGKGW
jgi:gluconolactonase